MERFDEPGLNQLVALNLFLGTVAEVSDKIDGIRTNWPSTLARTQEGHVKSFATYGVSGYMFPKYRITAAAGCLLAIDLLENWRGKDEVINKWQLETEAKESWNNLAAECSQALQQTLSKSTVKSEIDNLFFKHKSKLLESTGSDAERVFSSEFPSKERSISQSFSGSGEYFRIFESNGPFLRRVLRRHSL